MTKKETKKRIVEIELVQGVEGLTLYLNDYRIAGAKPWGGGICKNAWKVDVSDILEAIKEEK